MIGRDDTAAAIAAWLPTARWFAGKGLGVGRIDVAEAVDVPATDVVLALVDVEAGGETSRYVVPFDRATGADAALAPGFVAWLAAAALGGRAVRGRCGGLVGHAVGAGGPLPAGPATTSPLGGDASNTSLRLDAGGRSLAIKIIRRCRAGIQPEVEVGEFLAGVGWDGTPPFRGWVEYRGDGSGDGAAVATVHDLVPGSATAWDVLGGLVAAGGVHGPNAGRVLQLVESLGRTTAELHAALASRADVPAFAPQPCTAESRRAATHAVVDHAAAVLDQADRAAAGRETPLAARLRALVAAGPRLLERLRRLADIDDGAVLIRVHGDYHLGQVLVGPPTADHPAGRPLVIDFEGEPGRPLAARRAKTTACRDVAGMCRSFDYLLRHASRTGGPAYRPADVALLAGRFLDAYRPLAIGRPWWPARAADAEALLVLLAVDKAVYELAYELDNRPDWVEVPLAAVEAMLVAD